MAHPKKEAQVTIMEIQRGRIEFCLLGTSPLICNSMSEKILHELLLPRGRKNAAERASTLKHNPVEEFRSSIYRIEGETLIGMLSTAFKSALRSAALDMPGASKSQIGRLSFVEGTYIPIFGVPQLFMSVVRSADIAKTPDVRTRAILPRWAARVKVTYTKPILKEQEVVNLMAAGGITQGIGDWRPEKGKGDYGQFELVSYDDPRFLEIISTGGRAAQIKAMESPFCYDAETEKLLAWYDVEVKRRGFAAVSGGAA